MKSNPMKTYNYEQGASVVTGIALFIFTALLAILLFSCDPCRRAARLCPPVIKDSIVTNTVRTIEYRDTTLYVDIPGDSVYLTDTIVYTNNRWHTPMPLEKRSGVMWVRAWVEAGRMFVDARLDSAMLVTVDKVKETIRDSVSRVQSRVVTVKESYKPWYVTPLVWYFVISLLAIIAYLLIKRIIPI